MNVFHSLCGLLAETGLYGHWQFQKVVQVFKTPIDLGQYIAFRRGDRLVGFVTFALVSDEALEELTTGKRVIQPEDWGSGYNIFFVDFIAPYGEVHELMKYVKRRFREKYGKGAVGHWYRPSKKRSGNAVA